ncbi:T9SS type A sorting domain-containing protein [Carboxylicivirga mesophila]|uniref:T9SS type A sorting domain-containing protein n=1 Tax=Carboxylicivirga mesophila TaxID=1166478 RepID=A0ABS5KDK5_9BACT|nr:T9SS type A sorting domain-containing protein [Carboxylicivirga mesophila]MBS2213118.1 T9SS type A sorting domain-containing protein [Carboxylicivirga mesophila]
MKKILYIIIGLFYAVNISAQIDFSGAIYSVKSGNWSDPGLWSGGFVPGPDDDVRIENNHSVYIDVQGSVSGERIVLCRHLKVNQSASLSMGHDTDNFAKDLVINGSIECQGTFSSGRVQPGSSGDGSLYKYNSRIFMNLQDVTTYITGKGYFHPGTLSMFSDSGEKNVLIDLYNLVCDENLVVKSNNRVIVTTERYSYIYVKGTLGLTGSTYQWSSATAKANLIVNGLIVCNDISLFTKNPSNGESSSITINDGGSIYTLMINNGNLNKKSEAAGFTLSIAQSGLLRLGEGINFTNLTLDNPNFSLVNNGEVRVHYRETLTPPSEIVNQVNQYKPSVNNEKEALRDIFGASHIAGWYHFTDKPFMTEGLDYYQEFGSTAIKTTLSAINGKMSSAYPFNHTWSNVNRVVELLDVPEIQDLYSRSNIKTHTFWVTSKNKGDYKDGPDFQHASYVNEEQQWYELTVKLLETYGHLDKTFVYQNWEGDWMLRGQGVLWEKDPALIPDDVEWQIAGMARMFRARQRGTERARKEFPDATTRVMHGIELNKLWMQKDGQRLTMMDNNTPCLAADVIPHCRIDLASWSAYDGGWENNDYPFPSAMWTGLEMINYFTTSTGEYGDLSVQIGEFAINENAPYSSHSRSQIRTKYDKLCGLALAMDLPYFYLWNLYCSGQQGAPDGFTWEKGVEYETSFLYEWMDGKWLIEPDGTWGHAAEFLMEQFDTTTNVTNFETERLSYKMTPNPVSDYAKVKGLRNARLSIYTLRGQLLKSYNNYSSELLDMSQLPTGTYVLMINDGLQSIALKFIKQ